MRRLAPTPHLLRPRPPSSPQQQYAATSAAGGARRRFLTTPPSSSLHSRRPRRHPSAGGAGYTTTTTPPTTTTTPDTAAAPFRFATGLALFAKRPPRPFPPPFLSPPSASFSDALSTFDRSRAAAPHDSDGRALQGHTNGDDAVVAGPRFICVCDGVGAWSARPRGHAGLWARLMGHYWATRVARGTGKPDPRGGMQWAFERTVEAVGEWQGTTTAAGAELYWKRGEEGGVVPVVWVTNVGDSGVMVVRPGTGTEGEMVYKSQEQWHWFDCPRQLGTNSPDTPATVAVVDEVVVREGDVVLAMSDGVIDNLWTHEIVKCVCDSVERWESGEAGVEARPGEGRDEAGMRYVAEELMEAARKIAVDPFAESPFMEHAIEEGLPSEGGKMDDISVVAALCKRNDLEGSVTDERGEGGEGGKSQNTDHTGYTMEAGISVLSRWKTNTEMIVLGAALGFLCADGRLKSLLEGEGEEDEEDIDE